MRRADATLEPQQICAEEPAQQHRYQKQPPSPVGPLSGSQLHKRVRRGSAGGGQWTGSPLVCPPVHGKTKRDGAAHRTAAFGRESSNRWNKMSMLSSTDVIIVGGGESGSVGG